MFAIFCYCLMYPEEKIFRKISRQNTVFTLSKDSKQDAQSGSGKKFNRQLEELVTGEEIKANVINVIFRMKKRGDYV